MSSATLESVFVKTSPSKTDNDQILGYELLKTAGGYRHPIIIEKPSDPNLNGERYMVVSSGGVFPDDVQATMKPYFDRAGFSHHLSHSTSDTVEEQEIRVMIELPNGDQYHVQKLNTHQYYVSHDNRVATPPKAVEQIAKKVFPNY